MRASRALAIRVVIRT